MQIDNSFSVPLPVAEAWAVLLDVPRIATCMPGAALQAVEGERRYKGEVAVRLGPVMLTLQGRAEIVSLDEAAHVATVKAEGRDLKGRGGSSATVRFALAAIAPAVTRVDIRTDLALSGAIAQYGRGAGMIGDLADHLIAEFSRNLEAELARSRAPAPGPVPAESPPAEPPRAARPISGLRLAWHLLRRAIARLFKGQTGSAG
jgi:uncharacterized protein